MKEIDDWVNDQILKNTNGTLIVGEAFLHHYYRLLEGEKAGKVIIKTCAKIDGKQVVFYANGMTWDYVENLKDIRCEACSPTFSEATRPIDRSKATWYNDVGSEPQYYSW
jgi:hypothetical protein